MAGWCRLEAYQAVPLDRTWIERDLIERWIERAEELVDMVENIFPDAFMVWRTLHYCGVCPHRRQALMIGYMGLLVPKWGT